MTAIADGISLAVLILGLVFFGIAFASDPDVRGCGWLILLCAAGLLLCLSLTCRQSMVAKSRPFIGAT